MFVRKLSLFFICLLSCAGGSANAQSEARIRIVIPSIERVENDLKWIIELSPDPELKKQWPKLKEDILDAFTQGVDLKQPASIDLVFLKDQLSRELRVPIKDLTDKNKGFLNSIKGMGYTLKEITKGVYWEASEKKNKAPAFYMRYDKNYIWMATTKTGVPANPPPPTQGLSSLLAMHKDVIAELKNPADGIDVRRTNFKELRKQFEALIKFRRNEDPNAFELRKLYLIQQLNELERFVVESDHILASWNTSTSGTTPLGRGELSLTALPGTDLQKSIEQFAVKPSYFANVTLHPDPLVTGKITFPLDGIRKAHVKDFYKAVRPALEGEISKRPGKTDEEKAALKQATNLFLEILNAGADLEMLDAFIDTHPVAPGKNVLTCGIRAANGKAADEIVKILPKIKAEWQVEMNTEEHGGVSIHKLTIPKSRLESFQRVFAGETLLYVGTSKDAVWGAAGVDAVTHLKTAIDEAAKPAPEKVDPVVISYQVQVAKLVTLMEIVEREAPKANAQPTKEELQRRKDLEKYRKLAQAAMAGCNSMMHGELRRTGNTIEGFLEINECVLKYVGSIMGDGVKQLQ